LQWFFSLLLILFFQISPVFAEENLGVEVLISSDPQRTVAPKSLFTSVFTIVNTGAKEDTYIIEVKVPETWQVISTIAPVSLLSKESRAIPVTIFVPSNALATGTYEVRFSAVSALDPSIRAEAIIAVNVLPHARIKVTAPSIEARLAPGQSMGYNFTVVNLGNGKDRLSITASSAHGEKVGLSHEIVELDVGEQIQITATIHIPLDVSPGTRHHLTVRASSILLETGIFDEAMLYTQITEKRPKPEGLYKTLSSQVIMHLSGLGTGEEIAPQVQFNTAGYVTDTYWMNFNYQGPYYKTKENYRAISEEKTTLGFGNNLWDVNLGDTTVNLSELTTSSLSEKGERYHIHKKPLDAMFFNLEKKQSGFTEEIKGARLTGKIGIDSEVGLNFFESDETKTDLSTARSAEKKRMASITSVTKLNDLLVRGEYAGSKFDSGSGYENDKAWWLDSRFRKDRFYIDGEYIRAGPNYPGRRKDTEGYRGYLSYRVFKPQWVWVYNHKVINNPKKDPARNTDDIERIEAGTSFSAKRLPFFSFAYQIDNSKSERQVLLSDTKEKALIFRANESFGNVSASIDSKWSRKKDDITSISSRVSEYTARLNGRWQKISPWTSYTYNTEEDIIQDSRTTTIRKELGVFYQPLSTLSSSCSFSQEGVKGENTKDILSFDVTYNPWDDASFTIEGEMRDNHDEFDREWRVWLTFRKDFDMPVPLRIRSIVSGRVFIDENNNGILEEKEQGPGGINMLISTCRAITKEDGRFKFPSLIPGECALDIDMSSLPVDLAPRISLPYKIDLPRGKSIEVNIPLVRVCKVKGNVFEDTNKNGIKDEGEKSLSLIRLVIMDYSLKPRDTFSDNNGNYSFAGLLPGKYKVKIDKEWLPDRYILTTKDNYPVELAPGEEMVGLDFGAVEKERPVVKTFTTEVIEPPKPEKKEEPEKPKKPAWWRPLFRR
jgi:hypothetical protein